MRSTKKDFDQNPIFARCVRCDTSTARCYGGVYTSRKGYRSVTPLLMPGSTGLETFSLVLCWYNDSTNRSGIGSPDGLLPLTTRAAIEVHHFFAEAFSTWESLRPSPKKLIWGRKIKTYVDKRPDEKIP